MDSRDRKIKELEEMNTKTNSVLVQSQIYARTLEVEKETEVQRNLKLRTELGQCQHELLRLREMVIQALQRSIESDNFRMLSSSKSILSNSFNQNKPTTQPVINASTIVQTGYAKPSTAQENVSAQVINGASESMPPTMLLEPQLSLNLIRSSKTNRARRKNKRRSDLEQQRALIERPPRRKAAEKSYNIITSIKRNRRNEIR